MEIINELNSLLAEKLREVKLACPKDGNPIYKHYIRLERYLQKDGL